MSGAAPDREALIDLEAFRHNVRTLSALARPADTMLAVKADAYGHGMVPMARAALESGATSLAVLDIPAALELRAAGITAPIFAWMHDPDALFGEAAEADIDLGISAVWQLDAIAAAGASRAPRVHLKIDTGLSRNGSTEADWPALVRSALAHDAAGAVKLHAAWSHLADASPEDDRVALDKLHRAVAVAEELGARFELVHLAASSAGIRMPEARLGVVRFGIAAYGVSPFDDESARDLGLRPVMTLRSRVVSTKRVPAGHGVSYGLTYRTERESTLALVPLGYADGIPRIATGRARVWIGGRRYPIAGRIAMDQFVVDLGDGAVEVGDEVVVFGEGDDGEPTAEEWAGWAETIGDEIVARVGPRVERVYLNTTDALVGSVREIATPEEMHEFGRSIGATLAAGDVIVLSGDLGAGKTTFTRGLGEGMGVRGPVTSPTFVLARTHPSLVGGPALVHVDAYRLGSALELDDLDIDFAGSVVVVEWGRGLVEALAESFLAIDIERPHGAGAGGGSDAGTDADVDGAEAGDAPVEPRTVRITGTGERWR
ncbi:alanine racemase [Herbiconiux sp. CPCC 203407]|uniref:Alanine racemase n=1 Tax=Herbiconiux oxytropis TaxID=2970915 RepID=A0AA41XB72_9MICO|nr:alanine racemase [Herbiconiux oxytropis]MCS5721180.1 alanine racemase [Herbiconiux oxytropis]MCS5724832.1 alanine racemase [Herbiconiux oxytropis]